MLICFFDGLREIVCIGKFYNDIEMFLVRDGLRLLGLVG